MVRCSRYGSFTRFRGYGTTVSDQSMLESVIAFISLHWDMRTWSVVRRFWWCTVAKSVRVVRQEYQAQWAQKDGLFIHLGMTLEQMPLGLIGPATNDNRPKTTFPFMVIMYQLAMPLAWTTEVTLLRLSGFRLSTVFCSVFVACHRKNAGFPLEPEVQKEYLFQSVVIEYPQVNAHSPIVRSMLAEIKGNEVTHRLFVPLPLR